MLNKIKSSIVVQISFLFTLSILFILGLWIFFYLEQKHQNHVHNIARYFSVVSSLQPLLIQSVSIKDEMVQPFGMRVFDESLDGFRSSFKRGDGKKGFEVFKDGSRAVLCTYNPISSICLEDKQIDRNIILIHSIFFIFLLIQILLYIRIKKILNPLSHMQNKLTALEGGDLSRIEVESNYDEIKQIVETYNSSISKIDYILEMREMFNKIFMHEMKMPIAKGMFYLKQEPSEKTHKKIAELFERLNSELDEFNVLEELIVYKNKIEPIEHNFIELVNISIDRVLTRKDSAISIKCDENCLIYGDKELWLLCFKNLIDNALKYSDDGRLSIICEDGCYIFENRGESLPIDISQDNKKWKIEKNRRHKSSTGYGFGLFIIKNTILLNGYELIYLYKDRVVQLKIKKSII